MSFSIDLMSVVRDRVSHFEGTVVGRSEWSTGCSQYCVAPPVAVDGSFRELQWFDEGRLDVLSDDFSEASRQETGSRAGNQGEPSTVACPRESSQQSAESQELPGLTIEIVQLLIDARSRALQAQSEAGISVEGGYLSIIITELEKIQALVRYYRPSGQPSELTS